MQNKKGISDVVTTVLIVLITLVAIALLWGFLRPVFTGGGEKIQQQQACFSINLEVTKCTLEGNVTVKRNPGEANLKEIKLIFYRADGSSQVVNKTDVPDQLGSKVYANPLLAPTRVAVAAGIADSQGNIKYCEPLQPVNCQ